jgi:wobble nucleotide-excising tRNase
VITQIQQIRGLGVFTAYDRPAGMADFGVRNIIYGWNYSGKTTLSRIFSLLERKQPDPLFPGDIRFSIAESQGQINEKNYKTTSQVVRVFNSDYVHENLAISWQGKEFTPILLVGKESIDTERQIAEVSDILERCKVGIRTKSQQKEREERSIEKLKTDAARAFKATLGSALPFDARHLDRYLIIAGLGFTERMSADEYAADLRLAKTLDEDKPQFIATVTPTLSLDSLRYEAEGLRSEIPGVTRVIERLRENPEIANWVYIGLGLHDHKKNCEFCGNGISEARVEELRDHFSTELRDHQERLNALLVKSESALLSFKKIRPGETYSQFHKRFVDLGEALEREISVYNSEVRSIQEVLKAKMRAPFVVPDSLRVDPNVQPNLSSLFTEFNALVAEHNTITNNFGAEKGKAIERLKTDLAMKFDAESGLSERLSRMAATSRHIKRYEQGAEIKSRQLAELKAKINLAQQGCEELNGLIGRLLGSEGIKIAVAPLNGVDHFQLMRGSSKAVHLSEGEKTVIALAYFLTKLKEVKMDEAIIYIDDPISSLDSNHVFQVASLLKSTFMYKDFSTQKDGEWKSTCRQLFISTHSFEFLSMFRDMGGEKKWNWYMIKRQGPSTSSFENLPKAISEYNSEYHYLFSVIHEFHIAEDKMRMDVLLSIPNALRRFVELYTYSRLPAPKYSKVDYRMEQLWGERSAGIIKVLHHFSHGETMERLVLNNDMIAAVEAAVKDILFIIEKDDRRHFDALMASV